mgnify:FL=1
MDLREIIRNSETTVFGHEPVQESLNLKNEIKQFSIDPLEEYIEKVNDLERNMFCGDVGRYLQSFSWYQLSLKRTLNIASITKRYNSEVKYHPKNQKYSNRQKQIVEVYKQFVPYGELDFQNLLIHSYLLLERTIALSRRFLTLEELPSFTSFSKHKNFFKKSSTKNLSDNDYGKYISNKTDWFEIPLKVLRDKYLMHSAEKHLLYHGWSPDANCDLTMTVILLNLSSSQEEHLKNVKVIQFSPRRLARDINEFLIRFSSFALQTI